MKVEAGWTGLNGAIAGLGLMDKETAKALGKAIGKSTNVVRKNVRKAVPRKARGPHKVASSGVRTRLKGKGLETVGQVYLAQAAIPLAKGQKPHTIEARKGKTVKFGGDIFRRSVQHPGARPNPFFTKGIDASLPEVNQELAVAGGEVIGSVQQSIARDK